MKIWSIVYSEASKIWHSTVFWILLAVFAFMPLMLGYVAYLNTSDLDWNTYLTNLSGSISALLVVGFSFIAAWVFGREYTDKTIHELMVKPVSKWLTALSKFIVVFIWDVLLVIFTFAAVTGAGVLIGNSDGSFALLWHSLLTFFTVSLFSMIISSIMALLAVISKGYLAPIGLTFVLIVLSNIVMQAGLDPYFPWTIPMLFLENTVPGFGSIIILMATGAAGFCGTIAWWLFAEQK